MIGDASMMCDEFERYAVGLVILFCECVTDLIACDPFVFCWDVC